LLVEDIGALGTDSVAIDDPDRTLVGRASEVYLLNDDDRSIRVVQPQLSRSRVIGRPGQGPGELMSIGFVISMPDAKVGVFDPALGRFSVFSSEGRFEQSTTVSGLASRSSDVRVVGRFADGRFVGLSREFRHSADSSPRVFFDTATIIALDGKSEPTRVATIGAPARVAIGLSAVSVTGLSRSFVSVCDSGFVVVDTTGVRVFGTDGQVRLRGAPLPRFALSRRIKEQDVESAVSAIKDRTIAARAARMLSTRIEALDSMTLGGTVDAEGNLWAYMERPDGRSSYVQYSLSGLPLREIRLVRASRLLSVGTDIVVGATRSTSEEDVYYTKYYSLKKPVTVANRLGWCGASNVF
jgi:hypothetical protein